MAMNEKREYITSLNFAMIKYYAGKPAQIQHFIKVHSFAKLIGVCEKLSSEVLFILEAAALVHDIGIKPAMELYRNSNGKLQEKLGPLEAEKMLAALDFNTSVIERVCYLVGHHHTYDNIEGLDYQILVESDFLVNFYESKYETKTVHQINETIFQTETGKLLLNEIYPLNK